jgi:Bacterial pre-peptidase C-terminal domain
MRGIRKLIGLAAGIFSMSAPAATSLGQTSYPMVVRVEPVAVARGRTVEITISGQENFDGAWALLCEPPGLSAEVLKVDRPEQARAKGAGARRRRPTGTVQARLTVAAGAPLGPRELRVATPQGASSIGLVVVVDDPVVLEADDQANDRPASAQKLGVPCAVAGRISKNEDVDWYAFEATPGERITFEVWGNRLENKIHDLQTHFDPLLSVHDSTGRELATADNSRFADPLLSFRAPERGTYYLQVRDTTYAGNPSWCYALHAVPGPVATAVFPLAASAGSTTCLELRGPGYDAPESVSVSIPKDLASGIHLFGLPGRRPGLPVTLAVSSLPVVDESADAATEPDKSHKIKLPSALCGRLGQRGDSDGYRFEARKGSIYAFEVVARRAGSECDPVLRLRDAKGATVLEVDDTRGLGKDARIEWQAASDGDYVVQVSDLHDRGGDAFGYVLLAEAAQPDFALTCDPDKINVAPGGRVPVFVKVARRQGFSGPVSLGWDGLPAGISASPLTIPPAMSEGVSVVSGSSAAARTAGFVTLKGTGAGAAGPIVRTAIPEQEIYLPGGGRGRYAVDTLALAVTDPADITVDAAPAEISLAPGESTTIDVTVTRNPRYDKPVSLAVELQHLGRVHGNPLPPGVTIKDSGSKTLLGPKETKGKVVLQASSNAPACNKVPIAVMGHVSINFVVKTAFASAPILVSVRPKPQGR